MARGGGGKKKGAKGKKARQKAKLDRHWGQHVDDDEIKAAKYRKGKSRSGKHRSNGDGSTKGSEKKRPYAKDEAPPRSFDDMVAPSDSSDSLTGSDSDSDMDLSSSNNDAGGALSSLLSNIGGKGGSQKSKKKSRNVRTEDISDDEEEFSGDEDDEYMMDQDAHYGVEDDEEEAEDSDIDEESSDEDEEDNIDSDDEGPGASRGEDGYAHHFGKAPLPESEEAIAKAIAPLQKLRKVPCGTSHLDPSLDVMLSGSVLDRLKNNDGAGNSSNAARVFADASASHYTGMRKVLAKNWKRVNRKALRRKVDGGDGDEGKTGNEKKRFTALQSTLYPSLSSYADLHISAETCENRSDIGDLLALHVLNHVLTSRGRVQKHNRRMKELREREEAAEEGGEDETGHDMAEEADEERWRDQGYTRPKVLVLLPTRGTAVTFVQRMLSIMGESADIDHLDRFEAEYSAGIVHDGDDDDADAYNQRRKAVLASKGEDWNELFGEEANDDDDFKIGMSLTPNAARRSKAKKPKGKASSSASGGISVKLYSDFYRSDIILASPLALKMATSGDEENEGDVDFLSSVEVCMVLNADVLLMQNWDHVGSCLEALNHQPTKSNDTDFSRVRNYLLAGQAAYWKQLVFVSRIADPYIMSTFKRHANSVAGRLKLRRKVPADEAAICDVLVRVRQVFQRVPCDIQTQGDDRHKYFKEKVLPQIVRLHQKHTMIYVPSYFDFVALRNMLMKNESTSYNFVSVTEYSRGSEVTRGRARFIQGRKAIMLYTGRAHFFMRHKIKGARHLILFGLPEHAEFYPGLMNMLMEGPSGDSDVEVEAPSSSLALFTKYDAHALERIVGTKHCERMVKGEKNTFLFCS